MDIHVNEHALDLPSLSEMTLGRLLETVRDMEARHGRVLVRIELDGRHITMQDTQTDFDQPVAQFGRLEIRTDQPGAMAARTLREAGVHLPRLAGLLTQSADALREGGQEEATRILGESLPFWGTVQEVILRSAVLTQTDLAQLVVAGKPVTEHLQGMTAQLQELKGSLQEHDLVGVADLLEFELVPLAREWEELLTELADRFEPDA